MGIDPVQLRRRYLIPAAAMPFKTGLSFVYDSGDFESNMEQGVSNLRGCQRLSPRGAREPRVEGGKLRGLGVSNKYRACRLRLAWRVRRYALIVRALVTLFAGSTAHGQGHETVFKQIVCDRLGLDPVRRFSTSRATQTAFSSAKGTGGSRSATFGGSAFLRATEKIIEKAKKLAAHTLEDRSRRREI